MKCPHCHTEINATSILQQFASAGGKKSKRAITKDQQTKMQIAAANARLAIGLICLIL